MDFGEAYERYSRIIKARSWRERVPGCDPDDVMVEMLTCLWKAVSTHRPEQGEFWPYYWSVWANRRRELILFWSRRIHPIPVDDMLWAEAHHHDRPFYFPHPPKGFGKSDQMVWKMLALGVPVETIRRRMGLSKRGYYDMIRSWKTQEVRSILV